MNMLEEVNRTPIDRVFRRFATYKRAHLIFTDLERLARIVNNLATRFNLFSPERRILPTAVDRIN